MRLQGCAVLVVEASGPDPRHAKAASAAFHATRDGTTRLSCSGFAVQHASGALVVVTGPAALYPFLTQDARRHLAGATHASLVPGARLRGYIGGEWVPLHLAGLAEAPGAREALARLLAAASVAGPGSWRVGWPQAQDRQQQAGDTTSSGMRQGMAALAWAAHWASLAPYVAVLKADGATAARQLQEAGALPLQPAAPAKRGDQIVAVGAPFGLLAPSQFQGFVCTGVVSNVLAGSELAPSALQAASPALLAADLRCLPGMEGGPVLDRQGQLLGMLAPPVTAAAAQAQLAVVLPGPGVAAAVTAVLGRHGRTAGDAGPGSQGSSGTAGGIGDLEEGVAMPQAARVISEQALQPALKTPTSAADSSSAIASPAAGSNCSSPREPEEPALAAALEGVVAVAAGTSWASGVVVSPTGHVLTNAHLFVPRGHPSQPRLVPTAQRGEPAAAAGRQAAAAPDEHSAQQVARSAIDAPHQTAPPHLPRHRTARVLVQPRGGQPEWHVADVLHIFQGPLDLAVLQLRPGAQLGAPALLSATSGTPGSQTLAHGGAAAASAGAASCAQRGHWAAVELAGEGECQAGEPAVVAGFPLFSPSAELGPWVSHGNVAKVLRASGRPAMLLTTAAVHSGASGGAVLHPRTRRLLALVTSNAKHASGPLYPHLNFSIPAALLRPVLELAEWQEAAATTGGMAGAAAAEWAALDARLAGDGVLSELWGLSFSAPAEETPGAGGAPSEGAFGGARPPAALARLLEELGRGEGSQGGGAAPKL